MQLKMQLLAVVILASPPTVAKGQGFEPGTIAVLPFSVPGTLRARAYVHATSIALSTLLKNVLVEGQRFTAVLDRTGDAAILNELERTESVWNSGSAVQIAQDGQLNANYVAYGFITSQTYDPGNHCARIEFTMEISDVGTGQMIMSEVIRVDNDRAPGPPKLCTERSEETALAMARDRAAEKFRDKMADDFGKRFGYRLVDMRMRNGVLEVLIRASAGDPRRGTNLVALVTVTSAFGETYTEEIGRLKVERVEADIAIAEFENPEEGEAFAAHVNSNGPLSVQVKRR